MEIKITFNEFAILFSILYIPYLVAIGVLYGQYHALSNDDSTAMCYGGTQTYFNVTSGSLVTTHVSLNTGWTFPNWIMLDTYLFMGIFLLLFIFSLLRRFRDLFPIIKYKMEMSETWVKFWNYITVICTIIAWAGVKIVTCMSMFNEAWNCRMDHLWLAGFSWFITILTMLVIVILSEVKEKYAK